MVLELDNLEDYLHLLMILDKLMRKDDVYRQRCTPECPSFVEKDWNLLQLSIMDIEEKIKILKSR
jgi:hypothetical protein